MTTTTATRILAVTAGACMAAPVSAQTASALLREGDLVGMGLTVTSIGNPAVNHAGGYATQANTNDGMSTISIIWGNGAGGFGDVIRFETTIGNLMQNSFESFNGLSDAGIPAYSPSCTDLNSGTSGLDSVWYGDTLIQIEEEPVPAFPGFFSAANSRPGSTADGTPYWVGSLAEVPGGPSQFRALFYGFDSTVVLAAGDVIGGVDLPVEGGSGVDFDFRFTKFGTSYINQVTVETGSNSDDGVVVRDGDAVFAGGAVMRESFPVPMSIGGLPDENWDNFDFFGITEGGQFLVTGDTDGATSMDEFLLLDGEIILREGDSVSGAAGTFVLAGSMEGAYLNENGDWAAIWDVDTDTENVEALLLNGELLLKEGDPVDWNGDGMIDGGDDGAVIDVFTGISTLVLSDRDSFGNVTIYFTADVTLDSGDELEGFFCLNTSAGALALPLDIKPGSCPNSFNRNSNGVLPMALLGTDDIDIELVDVATLSLSRADGMGGSIAPNDGPPGPSPSYDDVATPFDGEDCDCHEMGADGLADLVLHFRSADLVDALSLDDQAAGSLVELVLSGTLLDGTPFVAADCVRLVPPGTSGTSMAVTSSVVDAWVDVMPLDCTLDGGGYASFERCYPVGSVVTLVAPSVQDGRLFAGWSVSGVAGLVPDHVLVLELDGETTVSAVYRKSGELRVANPGAANSVTDDAAGLQP